jgi:hypothetical protein
MALMTWGEFKSILERAGVRDDMPIINIEVHSPKAADDLTIDTDLDGFAVTDD